MYSKHTVCASNYYSNALVLPCTSTHSQIPLKVAPVLEKLLEHYFLEHVELSDWQAFQLTSCEGGALPHYFNDEEGLTP